MQLRRRVFFQLGDTLDNIASFDVDAIAPGRGTALMGKAMVETAIENTHDFVDSTYRPRCRPQWQPQRGMGRGARRLQSKIF